MARNALVSEVDDIVLAHGYCTFTPAARQSVHDVPDDFPIEPRVERFDSTAPTRRRLATAAEIADYDAAHKDATATQDVDVRQMKGALLYFRQQINVVRAALVPALPPLTLAEVRQGMITALKSLP